MANQISTYNVHVCIFTYRSLDISCNERIKTNLKYKGLVVLLEVEGEDVGVHQGAAALAENVHSLLQELHLDPRHVVLLHLLHLTLDLCIEL